MDLTKYVARTPTSTNPRQYLDDEFRRIQLSTDSIIALLSALNVPIEIGPADSAGVGFRVLRIPN
jgi:hypothetical protein